MSVKTFTLDQIRRMRDRTNVERLRRMKDEDIDFSDIPKLSEEFIRGMVRVGPKVPVSLRVDPDVMAWFKRHGRGYQTRINAVLRAYVSAQKAAHKPKKSARRAA